MNMKDILKEDIGRFINVEEFAEEVDIEGKMIPVLKDSYELLQRNETRDSSEYEHGTFRNEILIYVDGRELGRLPAAGKTLRVEGKSYMVKNADDEAGIYAITLKAVKS